MVVASSRVSSAQAAWASSVGDKPAGEDPHLEALRESVFSTADRLRRQPSDTERSNTETPGSGQGDPVNEADVAYLIEYLDLQGTEEALALVREVFPQRALPERAMPLGSPDSRGGERLSTVALEEADHPAGAHQAGLVEIEVHPLDASAIAASRSVDDGPDPVRALQRTPYRSAKQDILAQCDTKEKAQALRADIASRLGLMLSERPPCY